LPLHGDALLTPLQLSGRLDLAEEFRSRVGLVSSFPLPLKGSGLFFADFVTLSQGGKETSPPPVVFLLWCWRFARASASRCLLESTAGCLFSLSPNDLFVWTPFQLLSALSLPEMQLVTVLLLLPVSAALADAEIMPCSSLSQSASCHNSLFVASVTILLVWSD